MIYTHERIPNLNPPLTESKWPFGKYKGKKFTEATENYTRWAYVYQNAFMAPFRRRIERINDYLEKTKSLSKRRGLEQDLNKAVAELNKIEAFYEKFNAWASRVRTDWGRPNESDTFPKNKRSIKQIYHKRYAQEE